MCILIRVSSRDAKLPFCCHVAQDAGQYCQMKKLIMRHKSGIACCRLGLSIVAQNVTTVDS
eukprot:1716882-Amphidinium_carterae.1